MWICFRASKAQPRQCLIESGFAWISLECIAIAQGYLCDTMSEKLPKSEYKIDCHTQSKLETKH